MALRKQINVVDKIIKSIKENEMLDREDTIVVGVSGGPDSMLLLHALIELNNEENLKLNINVAHINHMIREEAIKDQELVHQVCIDNNLVFHVLNAKVEDIAKENKQTLEECGRQVRYEFFNQVAKTVCASKIFVAHNMNDSVETMLMNLMRGSGANGLTGISSISNNIYRPMLEISKKEIMKYMNEKKIPYAIDKTNFENDYTRNKIRNELILRLEEFNPNVLNTLNKTSKILFQTQSLADEYTNQEYIKLACTKQQDEIIVNKYEMKKMSYALQCAIIRKIVQNLIGNLNAIEQVHIVDTAALINKRYNR